MELKVILVFNVGQTIFAQNQNVIFHQNWAVFHPLPRFKVSQQRTSYNERHYGRISVVVHYPL